MMNYIAYRDDENLNVKANDEIVLLVKRRFDWLGRLITSIYQNEKPILITVRSKLFWYDKISIITQADDNGFSKIKGKMYLERRGNIFHVHENFIRKPAYLLYRNNALIGEVEVLSKLSLGRSMTYSINFFEEAESNFDCLLLFINEIYDTVD